MKHGDDNLNVTSTPKPLLEVNGVSIIRRIIERLNSDNINVAIVINPVDEELFNIKLQGLKFRFYYQSSPKGTADALYAAKQFISDDLFVVFMGDDIFDYDELNLKNREEPAIFAYQHYNCRNFGILELDSEGYIRKILEKVDAGKGLINTGIYIMPKQFFQIFPEIAINPSSNEYYLTEAISELYRIGYRIRPNLIKTWKGINFPVDLVDANGMFMNKPMIRLVRTDDIFALVKILKQLNPNSIDQHYDFSNGMKVIQKIVEDENYYLLVAVLNREIVSTATMLIQKNITHNGRPYAHIENVVTDKEYRKMGLGKSILSELIDIARHLNCYKIILNCSLKNSHFYENVGFVLTEEVEMRLELWHPFTRTEINK